MSVSTRPVVRESSLVLQVPVRTHRGRNLFAAAALVGLMGAATRAGTSWDAGGTDTNINTANNWNPNGNPSFDGTEVLTFGSGSAANINISVDVLGLNFTRGAAFALNAGGGTITIGASGITFNDGNTSARAYSIAAPVVLSGSQTWSNSGTSDTLAVTGNISGAASTNLTIAGIVTLSGDNSGFAGNIAFNSGTLNINSANALGTGTFAIAGGTINNSTASAITNAGNNAQQWNGDFTFTGTSALNLGTGAVALSANRQVTVSAAALTVDGNISGSGFSLTKAGAGLLVLGGTNSYTGGTIINAGTVRFAGSSSLPGTGNVNISGGGGVEYGAATVNVTLGTGSGELNWGTGRVGSAASGGSTTVSLNGGAGITWGTTSNFPTGALNLSTTTSTATINLANAINLNGASRTIDVANGDAAVDAEITGNITNTGANANFSKTGTGTLKISGTIAASPTIGTVNAAGGLILNNGTILGGHAFTLTGSTVLTVDVAQATIGNLSTGGFNFTVAGAPTNLLSFGTWNQGGGANTTVNLNITYGGGVSVAAVSNDQRRNIMKSGAGLLEIRGANVGGSTGTDRFYTFTLTDGGVALGSNTAIAAVGTDGTGLNKATTFLNLNGGTVASNSSSARDYRNTAYTTLGGNVTFGYLATTNVANAATFTGTQSFGAVAINGGAVRTVTVDQNTLFTSLTTSDTGGSLTKSGAASLTLDGPGYITGSTPIEVNDGTLVVNGTAGSAVAYSSSGASSDQFVPFADTSGIYVGQTVTYGEGLTAVVNQVFASGIKLNQVDNTFVTVASGTAFSFAASAGGTGSLGVNVNNAGTLAGTGTVAGPVVLTGGATGAALTSTASLTIANTLSTTGNNNSITSGTISTTGDTIAGGFTNNGTLGGTGTTSFSAGATVAGTGTFAKNATLAGTNSLSSTGTLAFGGTLGISGVGNSLSSGTVSVAGLTTVNNGASLALNGNLIASGDLSVLGTITGTGTTTGETTVSGILAPGNSTIGTLNNVGDVTWEGASAASATTDWSYELGTANLSDKLIITGDFLKDASDGTVFRFDFNGAAVAGTYVLIAWSGTTTFSASDFSYINLAPTYDGSFAVNGSQLEFTSAVPEPTSLALVGLGVAGLLKRRRRAVG